MSDPSGSDTVPDPHLMSEQCRHALQQALAEQEQAWRAGTPVLVEFYLDRQPVLRDNREAILDLVYKEILSRSEQGDKPE
jgi:hypothetical protein